MGDKLEIGQNIELLEVLTCLPEKFIVDFANGIDVVRDNLRVQQDRTGFFARLYDGFTGQGAERQISINASLADGVEGALTWLTELTESLAKSNFALGKVNERVATIYGDVAALANYSVDTRTQLADLSRCLNARVDQISGEIARVAVRQEAEWQLERVLNQWAAGRFSMFSCAGRCYAALEELRWGAFGDFCRSSMGTRIRQEFLDDLTNRAILQLIADKGPRGSQSRVPLAEWIIFPSDRDSIPEAPDALTYMGDWSEPELHPFVFTTSQHPQALPVAVPRLCSAERMAKAFVSEVFEKG